ncbi:Surfeit protein 2 [Heracleum sosnowskyi]|uniref:Surfeit protein 2 n=1 Tax=Heracleum sosnowskyi TaxID=360622 RepID=A0AAD8H4E8_9APIA|nr:Surfeit protein 2 [Heracleum sosnowskyi]
MEEFSGGKKEREGELLLGWPTFVELQNGRFKCLETGHELVGSSRQSYSRSKHCRLGLIHSALSLSKPPLNLFRQDPLSRSKLMCKLTGLTVNKTEEHIWKHITGRRFLNMLEKQEAIKQTQKGTTPDQKEKNPEKVVKKNKKSLKAMKKKNQVNEEDFKEIISKVRNMSDEDSDSEDDFWMPPSCESRDIHRGGRRGSDLQLITEADGVMGAGCAEAENEDLKELPDKVKRLSIEIGPSAFASRKKKKKISTAS